MLLSTARFCPFHRSTGTVRDASSGFVILMPIYVLKRLTRLQITVYNRDFSSSDIKEKRRDEIQHVIIEKKRLRAPTKKLKKEKETLVEW